MRICFLALLCACTLPILLSGQKQVPLDIALRHLDQNLERWGLQANDIKDLSVGDQYRSQHNGVTHLYLRQQFAGLPLHNAILGVHIKPNGQVAFAASRLEGDIARRVNTVQPSISAQEAVRRAATHLGLSLEEPLEITGSKGKNLVVFAGGGLSRSPIRTELVLLPLENSQIRLSWNVEIEQFTSPDYWSIRVDALNGNILDQNNYTVYCRFDDKNHLHKHVCFDGPAPSGDRFRPVQEVLRQEHAPPPPTAGPAYHVFPIPVESPIHGSRQIVENPADSLASPFGWHDTNGQIGPEYTITRGNNVHAYTDLDNTNGSSGNEPDGGAELRFDFPFAQNLGTVGNRNASVTQLFYMNNIMHDLSYQYGFTEEAGNFQQNNYGRGGRGGDPVRAESQDGSGRNNANFSSPADGQGGRMQMYLWGNSNPENAERNLTVNTPEAIRGQYPTSAAAFGPPLSSTESISGRLIAALGGPNNDSRVCGAVSNAEEIRGNIALIDRGDCFFEEKAVNAEAAGAIAVVICNNTSGLVSPMGGRDDIPDPGIPTVMITAADCQRIRNLLQEGVQITLRRQEVNDLNLLDASFDNGIVAHEYGHGISIRLTGGPSTSSCLTNNEQMGEGWSDFFSLITTFQPGQTGLEARGIGNFSLGNITTGRGIRRLPYSTDMKVNNQTYATVVGSAIPHGVGEIWAGMLWDLYWRLVDEYGWDDDLYTGKGGNNIALQLVFDGMKLQNCNPGFIDGRDAIIAADLINNDGANECLIWEVFARRGLGWSASQGSNRNINDGRQAFDLMPECIRELKVEKTVTELIKAGENITVTLTVTNHKRTPVTKVAVRDLVPAGASYIANSATGGPAPQQDGNTLVFDLGDLASGDSRTITYQLGTSAALASLRLSSDDMTSPEGDWTATTSQGADAWRWQQSPEFSGSGAWAVTNGAGRNVQLLRKASPVEVRGTKPVLRVRHRYDIQPGTDGGLVELSTSRGITWSAVPAELIFRNTYSGETAENTFAASKAPAFWGNSEGFLSSYIDLSAYNERNIDLRFNFSSLANSANDTLVYLGWIIDQIELIDLVNYQSEACVSSSEGDQKCVSPDGWGTLVESTEFTSIDPVVAGPVQLRVFPNPAQDQVQVALRSQKPVQGVIDLLSLDGRLLRRQGVELQDAEQLVWLPAADLPAGVYLVRLQAASSTLVQRVVIR